MSLSQIYGFMAITVCLMLASVCVINKVRRATLPFRPSSSHLVIAVQRKEDERFRKIDAKRGGKGFV